MLTSLSFQRHIFIYFEPRRRLGEKKRDQKYLALQPVLKCQPISDGTCECLTTTTTTKHNKGSSVCHYCLKGSVTRRIIRGFLPSLLLRFVKFPVSLRTFLDSFIGVRKRYYSYMVFRVSPDHSQRKTDLKKTKGALSTARW